MNLILAIAAGGGIGAVLRHFVSHKMMSVMGPAFPYGTITVNIFGSLLMGVLIGILARYFDGNNVLRAFLTVGLLGGFTTFSAFSLDIIVMLERGDYLSVIGYILISVICSIGGLWLGLSVMRAVL
jgi:CrcB protein